MKVPYRWLTEYVDVRHSPERLAQQLTMAGSEVTGIATVEDDAVLELEITPNRPDCLSVIGIAREVAALTGRKLRLPVVPRSPVSTARPAAHPATLKIRIADIKGCPRYIGRLIEGVHVGPSPAWLAQRLRACGVRPVNNIVDITNYVLWETGQPLHAFDADRLAGGQIVVRRAAAGERLVTIDGKERALDGDVLVIADSRSPVAVAGVMGGRATEVTEQTTRILLESAVFDPLLVRRGARRLGLCSDSSYRFERGIDPAGVDFASARAAHLIAQLAQGHETVVQDVGRKPAPPRAITVRPERLQQWLGTALPPTTMRESLERLGCRVTTYLTKPWSVQPPSFRRDLVREVDVLEEVARLAGYDRLPARLPQITLTLPEAPALQRRVDALTCETMTAAGFDEAVTYRLLSQALIERSGLPVASLVRVSNPLTQEQECLRPSLWPGLLQAAAVNLHRGAAGVRLFELGGVYHREGDRVATVPCVSVLAAGLWDRPWTQGKIASGLPHVQGAVDALLSRLGISGVHVQPAPTGEGPWSAEAAWGAFLLDGQTVGGCGEVRRSVAEAFDVKERVWVAELWLDRVLPQVQLTRTYQPLPRHPAIRRDIALIVEPQVTHQAISTVMWRVGRPLVTRIELFDRYHGNQVPAGHHGLAYSLEYRHPERTLTDAEVDAVHAAICAALTRELPVRLRK